MDVPFIQVFASMVPELDDDEAELLVVAAADVVPTTVDEA